MKLSVSLITVLLSLLLATTAYSEKHVIVLGSDPWPPYINGDIGQEANKGTAVKVFHSIFDRIDNLDVKLPLLPWKRALMEVNDGTLDGIQLLRKTPEREAYMTFSESIFISRELIWYSKKRFPKGFNWQTINDLEPYILGLTTGYSYSEEFDKVLESDQLTTTRVADAKRIFAMLAAGNIDIGLVNESVGIALAREHSTTIIPAQKPIAEEPHYIGFSKKGKASRFIPAINQAIMELKQEGKIERIILQNEGSAP